MSAKYHRFSLGSINLMFTNICKYSRPCPSIVNGIVEHYYIEGVRLPSAPMAVVMNRSRSKLQTIFNFWGGMFRIDGNYSSLATLLVKNPARDRHFRSVAANLAPSQFDRGTVFTNDSIAEIGG
jgi:hypothetical protein